MSSKEQQYHHVSIEERWEPVEDGGDIDEETSSSGDSYTATYSKSIETLQSFRELQRSRHDTIAMRELREYLDRISRRRTGYGIDPYVQRVMAAPPRRTLLRNRKVEAAPGALVGSLPAMLRQPRGLTRPDLLALLDEAVDKLRHYTAAAVSRVYVVDDDHQLHLHSHVGDVEELPEGRLAVTTSDTTVGYVAASGDLALVEVMSLVHQDRRYPRGLPWAPPNSLQSALAVPLCDDAVQRRCRAVVVLAQTPDAKMQLGWKDVTAAVCVISSLGAVVGLSGARTVAQTVHEQQDALLRLVLDFFAQKATVPATLALMLRAVKAQLAAARGMIFLADADDPTQAHLFREPLQPAPELIKRDILVSLSEDATAVLESVQRVEPVVLDAEQLRVSSRRLSRYLTPQGRVRAGALCLPLAAEPGQPAVAVIVLADKLSTSTGELDHEGFSLEEARRWLSDSGCAPLLSLVCGLARREVAASGPMRPQARVLRGWVVHTLRPRAGSLRSPALLSAKPLPPAFREWGWAPSPLGLFHHIEGVHLIVAAAEDLLGGEADIGPRSVWEDLAYTVAFGHRDVPYHNFRTALSILQSVYAILRRNESFFTDLELQAIFTAALGVILDHRGLTEQFIRDSDHPLKHCYPPPIMHNHHFEVLKIILETHEIFPRTDRKELLAEIRSLVLATEATAYFRTRRRLLRTLKADEFIWNLPAHRRLVKDALMAAAVHSALCKAYPDCSRAPDLLAEEWFLQGDLEREMGVTPLPVMDREQADARGGLAAGDALALVEALCAPAAELLTLALPNTRPMLRLAQTAARYWRGVSEGRRRRSTDTGRTSFDLERQRRTTLRPEGADSLTFASASNYSASRVPESPW